METKQLLNLSPSQLRRAAELKERIDTLMGELSDLLGGESENTPMQSGKMNGVRRKSGMSAEGRARIAAAARARWAKIHAAQGKIKSSGAQNEDGRNGRRTMSAAARQRMAEAARARWAKIKAAKG